MRPLRCTAIAFAVASLSQAAPTLVSMPPAQAAAAVSRTTPVSTSSVIGPALPAASERATDPPSSGIAPTTVLSTTFLGDHVPAWVQADPMPSDRRVDGVVLGPTNRFPALGNDEGFGDCSVVA